MDRWLLGTKNDEIIANDDVDVNGLIESLSDAEIDQKILLESAVIFKHSAIRAITEGPGKYSLVDTYHAPSPSSSTACLLDDCLQLSAVVSEIKTIKDPKTNDAIGYEESWDDEFGLVGDAKTSMSLNRAPNSEGINNLSGSASNMPFMPGGFDENVENVLRLHDVAVVDCGDEQKYLVILDNELDLLSCAPGMTAGITINDLENIKINESHRTDAGDTDLCVLIDAFNEAKESVLVKESVIENSQSAAEVKPRVEAETSDKKLINDIDQLISEDNSSQESKSVFVKEKKEFNYAVLLDTSINVPQFEQIRNRMVKKYPFELDPFQQQAVLCLDRGESVFVAAHTSAGKTVVAEYAIALCNTHKTRAIYTSPIKALSNQKFRDFKLIFTDVGLITGDIQLQPEAFALVMTTEILRSMLYNGSEVIRELEWVVFDEVHYINDAERGHVWEEVLIMLPAHVKIVMLSATVPNCVEFADWVGRIKNRQINVVMTARRPVPLEHFLYTGRDGKTKKDIFKIIDSSGQFLHRALDQANQTKTKLKQVNVGPKGYRTNNKLDKNIYITVIDFLRGEGLLPIIVFVFSRRRCDENAYLLQSVDLTTAKEKSCIQHFFSKCIAKLKGSDKRLPQVLQMVELCKRGFAVHHSGILPILKEVVEILFQKGLVKVLFATETFAMGVNMPARTVIFDDIQKPDGRQMRFLNAGEYIQMAGRAGRRGLDSTGTVIILCKGQFMPEYSHLINVLMGKPQKLESHFRVTYGMLLNLLRVEQLSIEDMLQRSFVESTSLRQAIDRRDRLKNVEQQLLSIPALECPICHPDARQQEHNIVDFHDDLSSFITYRAQLWNELLRYSVMLNLMSAGRLIVVCLPDVDKTAFLAILLKVLDEGGEKKMRILLPMDTNTNEIKKEIENFRKLPQMERQWRIESCIMDSALTGNLEAITSEHDFYDSTVHGVITLPIHYLIAVSKKCIKIDPTLITDGLPSRVHRDSHRSYMEELKNYAIMWNGCEAKLPGHDIHFNDFNIVQKILHLCDLRKNLENTSRFPCYLCSSFRQHFWYTRERLHAQQQCDELKLSLSTGGLLLSQDYFDSLKVLRRLNYIDNSNLVTLKGRVACEIHNQELLITELMLDNKFQQRSPAELAAMLSATTCQNWSKVTNQCSGPPVLDELKKEVLEVGNRIAIVQRECGLKAPDPTEELCFDLMNVVYEWANGTAFSDIMQLTEIQEGIIVRCIQRLDMVCREVRNAARLVGDPTLYEKMEDTSALIKRDIVFAASLYTVFD